MARAANLPTQITVPLSNYGGRDRRAAHRAAAVGVCFALLMLTMLAVRYGHQQGPLVPAFLTVSASWWGIADLATAALLIASFCATGISYYGFIGAAYGFSGVLTWPYLIEYPGVLRGPTMTTGEQQISVSLWIVWHCVFPLAVIAGAVFEKSLKQRFLTRNDVTGTAMLGGVMVLLCAALTAAAILAFNSSLPVFVLNRVFQAPFTDVGAPLVGALNLLASIVLVRKWQRLSALHWWLVVALFTASLDGFLNAAAPSRFSIAWYVGKIETSITATVVLAMLFSDIVRLRSRLSGEKKVDGLTSVLNRRFFDDYLGWALDRPRANGSGIALLVVDVDGAEKLYANSSSALADELVQVTADVLRSVVERPDDVVARYQRAQFVVVLPDVSPSEARIVGERIRHSVNHRGFIYDRVSGKMLTVSVGVGFSADAEVEAAELFDAADRALYEAKRAGENRVILGTTRGLATQRVLTLDPV